MLMRASVIVCRQGLFKPNIISQKVTTYRYIHLVRQVTKIPRNSLLDLHRNYRVVGIPLVRYASTSETTQNVSPEIVSPQIEASQIEVPQIEASPTSPYDEIPDPPTPIQEVIENIVKLHPNGEPTFDSIGLCNYTPVGFIEKFMELVHINCNMPWWATIIIGTICVRSLMFPLVISAQKNMANFSNHMPKIQELQANMTEARQTGDYVESARSATELSHFMKKNNLSPFKNIMMPLVQGPLFLSFFLALRKMANTPVESLKEGGFLWVMDLTMPDPYYIMPIITCITMYTTIELGAEGLNLKAMGIMRYALRAMPFVLLPFMVNFPGTVLTYWVSTNFISLGQTGLLKIPYVRKKFNMPTMNPQTSSKIAKSKKGFVKEFKESWTNIKISKQLENREQADVVQFNRAGKGPLIKTFKYDPTKQKELNIYAKKR